MAKGYHFVPHGTLESRYAIMIEGSMDILWQNYATPKETPTYKILFIPINPPSRPGAVQHQKDIKGEAALRSYLDSILDKAMSEERRQRLVNDWTMQIRGQGSLNLPNIVINEEQEQALLAR
jgi:hypothetical protein